jgi:hypothetical protein
LISQSQHILICLSNLDSALETTFIIEEHFARLGKDFIPILIDCKALLLLNKAFGMEGIEIRQRVCGLIGNFCRHSEIPAEIIESLVDDLLKQLLDENLSIQKNALFALGNVMFRSPEVSKYIIKQIDVLMELTKIDDSEIIQNLARIFGDIVRKSDQYLEVLIVNGAINFLISNIREVNQTGEKVLLHRSSFCQYETGRDFIQSLKAIQFIQQYVSSSNERVKRTATSILSPFERTVF